jgi:hypothetical protein
MDAKWLRTLLDEADRLGARPAAVQVLTGADMSQKTRDALDKLDLRSGSPRAAAPQASQADGRQSALET